MGTDDHDAWLKTHMNLDVKNPPSASAAPASADPGGAASKSAPLPDAGSGEQEKDFHDKLQQELTAMDGHLAYTAEHAETAKHAGFAAQREKVGATYKPTVALIDPASKDKAKPAIDKVLAAAKGMTAQIGQFRQGAEKAFNEWQTRQPKYDAATKQIGEMQQWGHPKAPPLQKSVDALAPKLESRSYAAASTEFDALEKAMAPVVADYDKQKAAQAEYEPARKALDDRLMVATACPFKKLEPLRKPFEPGTKAMDDDVAKKDYVGAQKALTDLTGKVTEFETKRTEIEAQQKAYQAALDEAQSKIDDVKKNAPFKATKPMLDDLDAGRTKVQATANTEDFVAAEKQAKDLSGKTEPVKQKTAEIVAQKTDYETARDALKDKLGDAAQSTYKTLEPQQQGIADAQKAMEASAADEDFVGAKKGATDLGSRLDTYATARKQLDEFKDKFTKARDALKSRLDKVGQPPHPKLKLDEDDVTKTVTVMDAEATAERFDSALAMSDDVKAKLDKYDSDVTALDDQKTKYEAAYKPAADLLNEINSSRSDSLAPMQQAAMQLDGEIKQQVANEDYDAAAKNAELLVRQLQDLKTADTQKLITIEIPDGPCKGKYTGTAAEIAAVRAQIVLKIASGRVEPLTKTASFNNDYLKDLEQNGKGDPVVSVVAFIFNNFVGDLAKLQQTCAAQMPAIDALRKLVDGNSTDNAQKAFTDAVDAVNAASIELQTFLNKIDAGAKKALPVLEAIRDTSFLVLAALAAPAIAGSAAVVGTVGTAGAELAGAAGGAAITELGKKATKFDDLKPVTLGEVVWDVSKAAAIGAVAKYCGGEMGKAYAGRVSSLLITKFAVQNPKIQQLLTAFVLKQVQDKTEKAVSKMFDGGEKKKKTWAEVAEEVANDFVKDKMKDQIEEWAKEELKEEAKAAAAP